jgi:hypothetical protein
LLSDRGNPIPDERCQLFAADGSIVEQRTDSSGVARFVALPAADIVTARSEDVYRPGVVFPDIMEEWADSPLGDFGKQDGFRFDHRRGDGTVHFVDASPNPVDIRLNSLTEEERLQHFIQSYTDHGAVYGNSDPREFKVATQYWLWGKGAVCNQHVNFFLGYWCNYNDRFTSSGSSTLMTALPMYSSDKHAFVKHDDDKAVTVRHRGYSEFLEPVTGFGKAARSGYVHGDASTVPGPAECEKAYRYVEYIRMSEMFVDSDGARTAAGERLLAALGSINVYSVSDIKYKKRAHAAEKIRRFMRKHLGQFEMTSSEVGKMKEQGCFDAVWGLDASDSENATLLRDLSDDIIWDHHAGVLLKRAKGGGPLTGAPGEEIELWTFSADGGGDGPPDPIVFKPFTKDLQNRRFFHAGIWHLRPLRSGGFASAASEPNAGGIGADSPPRFIKWKV